MIIVGELINSSRKVVAEAITSQDAETVQKIASDQFKAGADYIDVNAGTFSDQEASYLTWLTETVQTGIDAPCALDSPNPKALEAALKVHKGTAMINSISLEKERYDKLLPLLSGTDLKVVALCMSDEGMPKTVDDRMRIADKLVSGLTAKNVALENIFMDPLVQPISVDGTFGMEFIDSIEKIVDAWPGIHTMCGLSNISYGLPGRKFLNRTFMVMAITKGLNGAIINPLDRKMKASIIAAEALVGRDNYCMNFLKAFRAGDLE